MANTPSKYGLFQRLNLEDLYNTFLGLEERQQLFMALGGVLAVLVVFLLPVSCASSKLGQLEKNFEKGRASRESFMTHINEYKTVMNQLEQAKNKIAAAGTGSMGSIVESMANESGIGANIDRIKPVNLDSSDFYDEEGLDLGLSNVNLEQLTGFLYRIENHQGLSLKIKNLQIKTRYNRRDQLAVTLRLSTIRLKSKREEASE